LDRTTSQRLSEYGSATLAESGATVLDEQIRAVWHGSSFAAPAFTILCADGDNLAIHSGVVSAPRGSVLAIGIEGQTKRGYWGEVLTTAAEAAGIVALVIDGTVRDAGALQRHRFPVFARGIGLRGATKRGAGSIGRPTSVGGVIVEPGDWLVGDADGVVAVRAASLSICLDAAAERSAKESAMFERLRTGSTTLELLGLDDRTIER
jgi:4-hydroxy-4-methyl-2-oxoglutarate aldolase